MNWKCELENLEKNKMWDSAIELMKKVIEEEPYDVGAAISINYLLMNLLVEEDYDKSKHDYYADLAQKYFLDSYRKFYNNPAYLYYTGRIACMSEWYFGIELDDADAMMKKAIQLEPDNIIYQWASFSAKDEDQTKAISYAHIILENNSSVKKILESKGSLGHYLLDIMTNWSKRMISEARLVKKID